MCKIELVHVSKGEKVGAISFRVVDDPSRKLHSAKFWPRAPWAEKLKPTDVGDAKFVTTLGRPKKDREGNLTGENYPDEKFLNVWNGVQCPPPKSRSRRSSAGATRAPSETEILAQLASQARQHAIARYSKVADSDQTLEAAIDHFAERDFDAMIDLVNRAKGKLL